MTNIFNLLKARPIFQSLDYYWDVKAVILATNTRIKYVLGIFECNRGKDLTPRDFISRTILWELHDSKH